MYIPPAFVHNMLGRFQKSQIIKALQIWNECSTFMPLCVDIVETVIVPR